MMFLITYALLVALAAYMVAKEWRFNTDWGELSDEDFVVAAVMVFIPFLGIAIGLWGMGERSGKARKEREKARK